jgi:Peptidase family M1 domain
LDGVTIRRVGVRSLLAFASLVVLVGASPAAAPIHTIHARLTPATRTIDGDELISWKNITAAPAVSLQLHLYYNAWRDTHSTWMRERSLVAPAGIDRRPDEWAATDITSLTIGDGPASADVSSRLRFIAPDDQNASDRTVAELPLDHPVAPGQTIDIRLRWSAHVPRTFARTGAIGDYFFIAQWFPKLGVLEDGGWNCHQFHATTEFFSDFGVYDVKLTVPSHWIVGATGTETDVTAEGDGAQTHHFRQEDVRDFAWTTSPHYIERRERFEHGTLPPVDMRLLLQPEHVDQAERHFAATRAALQYYGEWYGPYPYGHITIVDPAWQSGTGGMEYPTLFTAGTRWLAPSGVTTPEDVAIHEAGHQFWYGMVANNEFEHAWMDEGINQFSTGRAVEQVYEPNFYSQRYFGGFVPWVFRDLPLSRVVGEDGIAGYRFAARQDVEATPSFRYWPSTAGAITYSKTALWLHTLERHLGWPTLQRAMSTYFERYAFAHPKPADFFAVVNEQSGQELTWYFDQVYRGSQVFDYGVDFLKSDRVDGGYRTLVSARRFGDGVFPVQVRLTYEDGSRQQWAWDGRDRWKMFERVGPSRALTAEVDPDRVLALDVNRTNNSVSLRPRGAAAARKWSLAWLVWVQDHLITYGFFA